MTRQHLTSACVLLLATAANAATIRVPTEQPTIQDGILAAADGDTVLVAPDTYTGSSNRGLLFFGKGITLLTQAGPESTIVNCDHMNTGFVFSGIDDSDVIVSGFSVIHGNGGSWYGGGIYCEDFASPTIENCVIRQNTADKGAGIACVIAASPVITNCLIEDNQATSDGAGIACIAGSNPVIIGCTFTGNTAGGSGGAVRCDDHSNPELTRCTVVSNGATDGSAIGAVQSDIIVTNSVIAFNEQGQAIACSNGDPSFGHCIVFGNAGGDSLCGNHADNLFRDPLFCGIPSGDVTLCENSPGLPQNNDWHEPIGATEIGCGTCTSPVQHSTWGRLKAMWRMQ